MNKFSNKKYIDTIKEMKIDEGDIIEYKDSDDIEIHIKGKKMQKLSKEISLKSIYDLMINMQKDLNNFKDSTNKRLDSIENDNKEIKQEIKTIKEDIKSINQDIKELQNLPTTSQELKNNRFL